MADDKKKKGKQDAIRVDSTDHNELEYLHRKFPQLTHRQIKQAVKKAGPMRKKVVKWIEERIDRY